MIYSENMSTIEYRTGKPDAEAFFRLFETTGWNEEYKASLDDIHTVLDHSWYIVSAHDNGKLVGTGRVISDGLLHAMVFDMIVDPENQGRGIGREILRMLVEQCRAHRIRDVQLFCAKGKVKFYEKNGFVKRDDDAPGMQLKSNFKF